MLTALMVLPLALGLVFLLLRVTGNPIESSLGDQISDEELARRIAVAGLDRPLWEQFVEYFGLIVAWDFGDSFKGQSVNSLIWTHITASIEVTALGLVFLGLGATLFASLAAWKPGSFTDKAIRTAAIVTYALPAFLLAVLLQLATRSFAPSFETSGRLPLLREVYWQTEIYQTGFVTVDAILANDYVLFFEAVSHLILPAVALAFIAGTITRIFRDSLVRELNSEEIQSALLRGIPEGRVFFRHAFVPSLPAALAAFGITAGSLITGVVFVEKVFEVRGLGYLLVDAVLARDFMVVQGIFIVTFLVVAAVNAVVDLSVILVDKRNKETLR